MTLGGPPAAILLVKPKMRNLMVHHSGGSQSTASPGLLPDTSHPTAAQRLPRPPTALTQHHLAPFSAQHACSGLSGGSNHRLSVSLPLAAGTAAADGMRADCGPSRKNLIPDNKTLQCAFAFHLPRRGNLQDASILSFESRDNGSAPHVPSVQVPHCLFTRLFWTALYLACPRRCPDSRRPPSKDRAPRTHSLDPCYKSIPRTIRSTER